MVRWDDGLGAVRTGGTLGIYFQIKDCFLVIFGYLDFGCDDLLRKPEQLDRGFSLEGLLRIQFADQFGGLARLYGNGVDLSNQDGGSDFEAGEL